MIWATVTSLMPCSLENFSKSGTRAMVPSSFMISQITPAGLKPASLARSTAASVWPARCRTPPSFARKGNTCPGITRSSGPVGGGYARRDAVLRLDRGRERCTHPRSVVGDHLWYVEAVDDLPRHRQADQTTTVGGHEVDVIRGYEFGGHGQVALVLTVLVVTNDDHLALLDVLDDLLYGTKRHLRHSSRRLKVSLPAAARAAALRTYLSCRPRGLPCSPPRAPPGSCSRGSGAVSRP